MNNVHNIIAAIDLTLIAARVLRIALNGITPPQVTAIAARHQIDRGRVLTEIETVEALATNGVFRPDSLRFLDLGDLVEAVGALRAEAEHNDMFRDATHDLWILFGTLRSERGQTP